MSGSECPETDSWTEMGHIDLPEKKNTFLFYQEATCQTVPTSKNSVIK